MAGSGNSRGKEKIWNFNVSDPTLHPNGFTIYKVTCGVFQLKNPESLTEIVTWKRYNDFKQLYKGMSGLHRALHRKDEFPPFARPKLFGRFDESVIEERRQSAVTLLNFVGGHYYLYSSKEFQAFLKGGRVKQGVSGPVLKPSKLDIVIQTDKPPGEEGNHDDKVPQPIKHPPDGTTTAAAEQNEHSQDTQDPLENNTEESLEGVWNFPQVPDNISLNSFDETDDTDATDVDSALGTPLPDTELSFFDPLSSDDKLDIPPTPELRTSSSWLFAAMNTCAEMDKASDNGVINDSRSDFTESAEGIQINFENQENGDKDEVIDGLSNIKHSSRSESLASVSSDLSEFDPLRSRGDSKVECGKGDLDLSGSYSNTFATSLSSSSSATSSPKHQPFKSPVRRKPRTVTNESVSTMDLGGKEDYIYIAANQICLAQDCEANARFDLAFSHYKSGVGILLQGVQGDKNKSRRDAVRRKTAQYLLKAEDLYNRHLASEILDERRWGEDSKFSPELDPSLTLMKGSLVELKNFKVLGTIDKVLLVLDKASDETYIIKTLHKSSTSNSRQSTILPTSCPYMVNLLKFYETDNAVYLLLQYATGGKLWNYISAYIQGRTGVKDGDLHAGLNFDGNIYSGVKLHEDDNLISNYKSEMDNQTNHNNILENTSDSDLQIVSGQNKLLRDDSDFQVKYMKTSDQALSPEQVSIQNLADGENELYKYIGTSKENMCSNSGKNVARLESLSSEENFTETENSELKSASFEQKDFQDLLKNNKSELGLFSINSTDESSDEKSRYGSCMSDIIDVIIEESGQSTPSNETAGTKFQDGDSVFIDSQNDTGHVEGELEDETNSTQMNDADDIVQSAKELIKSVERTLSQTDSEVESMLSKTGDFEMPGEKPGVSDIIVVTGKPNGITSTVLSGNSSDTVINDVDSNEPNECNELSIYDIHRSSSSSGSNSDVDKCHKSDLKSSEASQESEMTDKKEDSECDTLERKDTLVQSQSDDNSAVGDTEVLSRKSSRSSTLTENTPKRKIVAPAKLSLVRMNSKELSRSASMEHELTSPPRTRQRTVSDVFRELDLAAGNVEAVRLPETCIQQWIAEIVVAVARLHAEGIICRDLKPDNILLGERGHVTLTYFCQLSNVDKELDQAAVEELFVAPEVRSISGYNEVCDWWSLGALLYELLVGRSLSSCHPGGITSHTQLYIPDSVSPEAHSLLQQLLCYNPRERLGAGMHGAEEIKSHPFFASINWNELEN